MAPREFPFPADVTRRERLTFSKHAGMQLQELGELLEAGNLSQVSVEAETALLLIAAQRVDPSITFDDCLDHDDWVLAEPEGDAPDPLDEGPKPKKKPKKREPTESTSSPT